MTATHPINTDYFAQLTQHVREKSWARLTREDIVNGAPPSLEPYFLAHPVKQALWIYLIDQAASQLNEAQASVGPGMSPKDVLFEGIVTFLDGLLPQKPLFQMVYEENPMHLLSRPVLLRVEDTLQTILERATISTASLKGFLRLKALNVVFISIFKVWLEDDTPDQSKMLSCLDARLAQAEELAGYLGV
jgi:hypothetical protein